ncbi:Protein MAIN-LIKE 1 [Glycine max]|nr:Protein MAIN-LIKE 1 [Glycine max]
MLKVFQANPMIHQFSEILKITLLLESGMKRYLKFFNKEMKMTKFRRPALEIEGLVVASGLSPLIAYSLDTGDRGLTSAFETSNFHLPVREVTITLDDVASLLHLPVVGAFYSFELLHVDDTVDMLAELLEVSAAEVRAKTIQCHGSYIEACDLIVAARAYLLHLLGCTLFAKKSATHVHMVFLDALCDVTQSGGYAWGAAALVHMDDNLNDASKSTASVGSTSIFRPLVSLFLPRITMRGDRVHVDERLARHCLCLDRLTPNAVCWILYGDHRLSREFESFQMGPLNIHSPTGEGYTIKPILKLHHD